MKQILIFLTLTLVTVSCSIPKKYNDELYSGKVINSKTGKPMKGVLVLAKTTSVAFFTIHNDLLGYDYTDDDGNYKIKTNSKMRFVASTDTTPIKAIYAIEKTFSYSKKIVVNENNNHINDFYLKTKSHNGSLYERPRGHFTDLAKKLIDQQLE